MQVTRVSVIKILVLSLMLMGLLYLLPEQHQVPSGNTPTEQTDLSSVK